MKVASEGFGAPSMGWGMSGNTGIPWDLLRDWVDIPLQSTPTLSCFGSIDRKQWSLFSPQTECERTTHFLYQSGARNVLCFAVRPYRLTRWGAIVAVILQNM